MSKYTDLQIECQKMWNKKVEVIPVTIGATRIFDRNIKSYVRKIPGYHNIYNLQRLAILGTAHILRKVLSIKPEQKQYMTMWIPGVWYNTRCNMVESNPETSEKQPPIIIFSHSKASDANIGIITNFVYLWKTRMSICFSSFLVLNKNRLLLLLWFWKERSNYNLLFLRCQ